MKIPNGLARQALKLEKNSPKLLFGAGLAGMVGSTVLACRATLQLSDVLQDIQNDKQIANDIDSPEEYSEKDRSRDLTIIQVRGVAKVARLYAPSVVLGMASIAMLTKSHNILQERNAALTAAYVALERGFNEYRDRVREKYGEEAEDEIRFPRESVKEINPKTGREHTVQVIKEDGFSIYARIFDEKSKEWSKDAEFNLIFLKHQEQYANDLLRARGHVLLNDIYDALDIPRSSAGAVCGWVLGDEGDNHIDFGIYHPRNADFVNGQERSVVLDFNVDGLIYDLIEGVPEERLSWQRD